MNAERKYGISIALVIPSEILRCGIENQLCTQYFVKCLSVYNDLDEIPIQNNSMILIFDTTKESDFSKIRCLIESMPKMRTILISSSSRLLENYLFARNTKLDVFIIRRIQFRELYDIIERLIREKQNKTLVYSKSNRDTLFCDLESPLINFSNRELEVLHYVGQGMTNPEIALILDLSYKTIESHRRRMIERMDVTNIIPVIIYANNLNYIPLDNIA